MIVESETMELMAPASALRIGLVGTVADETLAVLLSNITTALPAAGAGRPHLRLLYAAGWPQTVPPGPTAHVIGGPAEQAGDLVVHNADLLIAGGDRSDPWDRVVNLALELGLPVLQVMRNAPVRLLTERFWRVSKRPAVEGDAVWPALRDRLSGLLSSPPGSAPAVIADIDADRRLPARALWQAHRFALRWLGRTPGRPDSPAVSLAWWSAQYERADALANGYANRYRSSYTIVLGLAAIALMSAVLGLVSEHHWRFALPEALCLGGIIGLVWANTRFEWRQRLIQCRLLAELCRKQAALAVVGRSLPASRIAGLTRDGELSWIGWRFATSVRSAPLPMEALTGAALAAARDAAAAVLLRGQREYHEARAASCRKREATLVLAGGIVFGATVMFVLVKIALLLVGQEHHAEWAGLAATLLPAVAAALFGFRAYAELELLVQQSERLISVLESAQEDLFAIDPECPGAGPVVGDVLEETATEMLADVAGWIQVSRVKAVEAG